MVATYTTQDKHKTGWLGGAIDQMESGIGVYYTTDLADWEGESGLLKRLLHLASAEETKVTMSLKTTTIGSFLCNMTEILGSNSLLNLLNLSQSLLLSKINVMT